ASNPDGDAHIARAGARPWVSVDRIGRLLQKPDRYLQDVFGWGTPGFDGVLLFKNLKFFLEHEVQAPVQTFFVPGQPAVLEAFLFNLSVDPDVLPPAVP